MFPLQRECPFPIAPVTLRHTWMTVKKSNSILLCLNYNVIIIPIKMQAFTQKTSSCSLDLVLIQTHEEHIHEYVYLSICIFILCAVTYIYILNLIPHTKASMHRCGALKLGDMMLLLCSKRKWRQHPLNPCLTLPDTLTSLLHGSNSNLMQLALRLAELGLMVWLVFSYSSWVRKIFQVAFMQNETTQRSLGRAVFFSNTTSTHIRVYLLSLPQTPVHVCQYKILSALKSFK